MPRTITDESFDALVARAITEHDGHLTIFRFTTEWKVMMGTPSSSGGPKEYYKRLNDLPGFETLTTALTWACGQPRDFWEEIF